MEKETAMKILKELHGKSLFAERTALETIIPELKESEDERVKKRILLSLEKDLMATKNSGCNTQDLEQCITWLEKQGKSSEQIHYWTEEEIEPIISDYLRGAEHYGGMIGRLKCLKPKSLEKQGEQKPILDFKASNWYVSKVDGKIHDMTYNPTDKVESKFKVGDYIVSDYCMGRVIEITNDAYLLDIGQGIPFSCKDNVHLWTIQDAMEGNILAGKIDGDNYILIFKTIKDGWIETYGHYYNAVNRFCVPSQLFCRDYQGTFTPATKEQRDTLMKAMTDAGYEWNAEKKELKKVEQKPVDKVEPFDKYEGLTDFERTLADICIGWIGEELGWKQYIKDNADVLLKIAIKKFNSIQDAPFEQKPAWSDEDENYLQSAENACEYQYGKNTSTILWLKSIKDRIGG